ncbi:MAG: hypothetical protein ACXVHQ_40585 [Solirubrobacteraceae bacterium]
MPGKSDPIDARAELRERVVAGSGSPNGTRDFHVEGISADARERGSESASS